MPYLPLHTHLCIVSMKRPNYCLWVEFSLYGIYITIAHCHIAHLCIVSMWQNIYCGSSFVYNSGIYITIAHCHITHCRYKHLCIVSMWQNIYCGSSFVYNRGVRRRQRVSATDRSFVSAQPPLRILSPLGQDFNIQNRILKLWPSICDF